MTSRTIRYTPEDAPVLGEEAMRIKRAGNKGQVIWVPVSLQPAAWRRIVEDQGAGVEWVQAYRIYMHTWAGPEPGGLNLFPLPELQTISGCRSHAQVIRRIDGLCDIGVVSMHHEKARKRVWLHTPDMQVINIVSEDQQGFVRSQAGKCAGSEPADRALALLHGTTTTTPTETTTAEASQGYPIGYPAEEGALVLFSDGDTLPDIEGQIDLVLAAIKEGGIEETPKEYHRKMARAFLERGMTPGDARAWAAIRVYEGDEDWINIAAVLDEKVNGRMEMRSLQVMELGPPPGASIPPTRSVAESRSETPPGWRVDQNGELRLWAHDQGPALQTLIAQVALGHDEMSAFWQARHRQRYGEGMVNSLRGSESNDEAADLF